MCDFRTKWIRSKSFLLLNFPSYLQTVAGLGWRVAWSFQVRDMDSVRTLSFIPASLKDFARNQLHKQALVAPCLLTGNSEEIKNPSSLLAKAYSLTLVLKGKNPKKVQEAFSWHRTKVFLHIVFSVFWSIPIMNQVLTLSKFHAWFPGSFPRPALLPSLGNGTFGYLLPARQRQVQKQ